MKRLIKFRAWDKVNNSMHEVESIEFIDRLEGRNGANVLVGDKKDVRWIDWENLALMQFTGVYDRLGSPIYEGDILTVDNSDDENESLIICDVVNHSGYCFELKDQAAGSWTRCFNQTYRLKIIGNKYQTK